MSLVTISFLLPSLSGLLKSDISESFLTSAIGPDDLFVDVVSNGLLALQGYHILNEAPA